MNINQKIEWITSGAVILSGLAFLITAMANMDIFGNAPVSAGEILTMLLFFACLGVWFINYIVKVIKAVKTGSEGKVIPAVWTVCPLIIIAMTFLLVNGARSFSREFAYLNVFSTIGVVLMVIIYNFYYLMFFGIGKKMYGSLFLYNAACILYALSSGQLPFIHNVYLAFLLPAVIIGYLELVIRNSDKKT